MAYINPEDMDWDEDSEPDGDPNGDAEWCDICQCPIGCGSCAGCVAVSSITPPILPPYEG